MTVELITGTRPECPFPAGPREKVDYDSVGRISQVSNKTAFRYLWWMAFVRATCIFSRLVYIFLGPGCL